MFTSNVYVKESWLKFKRYVVTYTGTCIYGGCGLASGHVASLDKLQIPGTNIRNYITSL